MRFSDTAWRAMTGYDLDTVFAIANRVYPGLYEDRAVLAERLELYRTGCHVLEVAEKPVGYVLSHPWRAGTPPALNTSLGTLPPDADSFYIHDLALLPVTRGIGAAAMILAALTKHAQAMNFSTMGLVAVNRSAGFWRRQGFSAAEPRADLTASLESYDEGAGYMVKTLTPAYWGALDRFAPAPTPMNGPMNGPMNAPMSARLIDSDREPVET